MEAAGTVDELIERIRSAASLPEHRCASRVVGNHIDITVAREDRHRWSPCLHLELCAEGAGTIVHGIVGPHPSTWTLFAFTYGSMILVAAFGLMTGLVQWSLGLPAWGFWLVPLCGLGLLGMYMLSQLGRRFAAVQTRMLMGLIHGAVGGPGE